MPPTLTDRQLAGALRLRDLSDPASGPHAMQLIVAAVADACKARWRCPAHMYRASPIVTVAENYEVLGYPPDARAREARYTRYLDDGRLLRTHTSAMIPQALCRVGGGSPGTELAVACPGLVYRRDVVDRLHVGEPHQLDLWRVRRDDLLGAAELTEMVDLVVSAVIPGARHRTLPASHPYTRDGREVEVLVDGAWVELLECGLAAPHVLHAAGLDPATWSGLALGIGLDRAVMLRKGIADIRLLRSSDPRVGGQMLTLDAYREVSSMPPATRDISIAVASGTSGSVTVAVCPRCSFERVAASTEASIHKRLRSPMTKASVEVEMVEPGVTFFCNIRPPAGALMGIKSASSEPLAAASAFIPRISSMWACSRCTSLSASRIALCAFTSSCCAVSTCEIDSALSAYSRWLRS